jgi:hypothetical protein
MENKTTLEIIIDNAEFAKEFNYFITIQLDGNSEKRRTDVSDPSKAPTFKNNKFYLPLDYYDLVINQRLHFGAFVVIDRPEQIEKEGTGQAKLLGENILELASLTDKLTNLNEAPIKQRLDVLRRQNDNNAIVGRLNITLKLLAEAIISDDRFQQVSNDHVSLIPELDATKDFTWRLRVDVRSAINLPFNRTTEDKLPSAYIELGWTMYEHQDINVSEAVRSSSVDANRFPIWNQQLLYYPPPNVKIVDGFVTVLLKDVFQVKPIQKFNFPLNVLKPFHPVHLDIILDTEDDENRSHLFISFTLEEAPVYRLAENLVNIIVNNISFDPLPLSTNRVSVMMTTDKFKPEEYI